MPSSWSKTEPAERAEHPPGAAKCLIQPERKWRSGMDEEGRKGLVPPIQIERRVILKAPSFRAPGRTSPVGRSALKGLLTTRFLFSFAGMCVERLP
jgi:hypothetical protein